MQGYKGVTTAIEMTIESIKIYGLCLERLKHQINIVRSKIEKGFFHDNGKVILESYNTGDIDDIIDILELYDINDDKEPETLKGKLEEVAESASLLIKETLEFGFSDEGHLCLYLRLNEHK